MEEEYIDVENAAKGYERTLALFEQDPSIGKHNKELVLRFVRDAALGKTVIKRSKKKIGPSRLKRYINELRILIDYAKKDLDKLNQQDMELFIESLESNRIQSQRVPLWTGTQTRKELKPFSERYKVDIKNTIRKFYKWLWGNNRTYPEIVEWIDTYTQEKEIPALTQGEIERMLDLSHSFAVKALVQVLFEGGFRIGELLNVRLRHVNLRSVDPRDPTKKCYFVRVPFSKTLRRTIALPMPTTTKWLTVWIERHPGTPRIQPDGTLAAHDVNLPLFPMTANAVRLALRRAGKIALQKRVYPHLLRHSSATFWSNKLPWFKLCKRFGWTMTSSMPQRYIDREGVDEMEIVDAFIEKDRGNQTADKAKSSKAALNDRE